jgi:transcription-repair coupling factor (superfamily II helicase)
VERSDVLAALPDRLADDPAFRAVVEELRAGRSGTIDGAWGSARSLALAAMLRARPKMLVVVAAHDSDVELISEDLRTFARMAPAEFPALDAPGPSDRKKLSGAEAFGRRLAVCKSLESDDPPKIVLTTMTAMLQPAPSRERIASNSRRLKVGFACPRDELISWLVVHGWQRRDAVETAGEFSVRGGIIDLFPVDARDPFRIEMFGDDVESIREFAVESQRSLRELQQLTLTALGSEEVDDAHEHFADVVPDGTWFAFVEPVEMREEARQFLSRVGKVEGYFSNDDSWARMTRKPSVVLSSLPFGSVETTCSLRVEGVERFSGDAAKVKEELDKTAPADEIVICAQNEAEAKRIREVLQGGKAQSEGRLHVVPSQLSSGFRWVSAGLFVLTDNELFRRTEPHRSVAPRRKRFAGRAIDSFLELRDGDYVVHLSHGIGLFRGMKMLEKNGQLEEHLQVEFADRTLMYVPASKIELVQRYVGSSAAPPKLSKVGGTAWEKRKAAVRNAVRDLAGELLDLQAQREVQPGITYPPDSEWVREFEGSFPYTETPDQLTAMENIKADMERPRPMDRLICGDVGYGKTELAMRAAFKAVDSGKQVALLAPTTVLAQQHLRTFRDRMAGFPFVVEVVSRFQTKGEQKSIVEKTSTGGVDVLIGTHRLLSKDVRFQDIGLVIIDEEQRFGVEPKERIKKLRSQVDVLTLTATPIPRTLHSALVGLRDISNLETAPQERMAVESRVIRFDPAMIRHAMLRELNRGGQVYFVHNRIQDIAAVKRRIEEIVPEAKVVVLHGQMHEHEVEDAMLAFLEKRANVLLATTIIESGLDIPNANTIFIDDGDRYGLADLHQLRGRVGRSRVRAYCYILVDEHKALTQEAQRRLRAIEEFSQLGAGFQIALRDLEIRGAGNILGSQQSGHIAEVGYELYCQMLDATVRALKRLPLQSFLEVTVELPWKAYFPAEYLPGERYRIDAYRRLGQTRTEEELAEFRRELEDRFGSIPDVAKNLLDLASLRILCQYWQIDGVRLEEPYLVLHYRNPRRIKQLADASPGSVRIVDSESAYLPLAFSTRDGRMLFEYVKAMLDVKPE